jgi:hypothetical protein
MGIPVFRFTLTHDQLGSILISEPDGWSDAILKVERHPDFHSLVEYFEGSFIFYGENDYDNGGADFIRSVESQYGFDTEIEIDIEVTFDNENYETIFSGLLDLTGLQEVKDNKIEVPIIRNSLWAKFLSRREIPVNLLSPTDMDGNPVDVFDAVDINLTSQIITQNYNAFEKAGAYARILNDSKYFIQYTPDNVLLDEVDEAYALPFSTNPEKPVPFIELEYGGTVTIDIRIQYSFAVQTFGFIDTFEGTYFWFLQLNDNDPIQLSEVSANYNDSNVYAQWGADAPAGDLVETVVATYSQTIDVRAGDQIRLYYDYDEANSNVIAVWGVDGVSGEVPAFGTHPSPRPDGMIERPSYITISHNSIYPPTEAKGFLIHDAFAAVIQRIVGRNAFYSEIMGSTSTNARQYDSDGCYCPYMILQGLQIRGYSLEAKQYAVSFDKLWKGANPIFNLGLGYEMIDGVEMIRLEKKEYFYEH